MRRNSTFDNFHINQRIVVFLAKNIVTALDGQADMHETPFASWYSSKKLQEHSQFSNLLTLKEQEWLICTSFPTPPLLCPVSGSKLQSSLLSSGCYSSTHFLCFVLQTPRKILVKFPINSEQETVKAVMKCVWWLLWGGIFVKNYGGIIWQI